MARGLHQLSVRNFGMLAEVEVELGPLNVLVGPNGSGKSTLLRVIEFIGDAARLQLPTAIGKHGGFEQLQTRPPAGAGQRREAVVIGVKAEVTTYAHSGALDEYELVLRPVRTRSHRDSLLAFVREERFRFKRTKNQGRRITLKDRTLQVHDERSARTLTVDAKAFGLAILPQLGPNQGGAEVRKIQELFTTFRVFDVDTRKARLPSPKENRTVLQSDAANLAAFLAYLQSEHSDRFHELLRDARMIVPGLDELKLRAVGGAEEAVVVDVVDHGRAGATPLANASFGTVRALALLALLHDPNPPLLTCVEEIDHGLHPHVFDRLVELLREAATRQSGASQFLIATHSPALVNRLRPQELIVCERDQESGLARIPAIESHDVVQIKNSSRFGLGELWFSGTLGGVPQ